MPLPVALPLVDRPFQTTSLSRHVFRLLSQSRGQITSYLVHSLQFPLDAITTLRDLRLVFSRCVLHPFLLDRSLV